VLARKKVIKVIEEKEELTERKNETQKGVPKH